MDVGTCVISFGNYEGGLMGLSTSNPTQMCQPSEKIKQEFAFQASDSRLTCCAANGNLLAVAGHEEVVKLYDLQTKKSIGDLSGVHRGSITCLAATQQHVVSGAVDGEIVIWRIKDAAPVHTLRVKNVSIVQSLSLHPSQRMVLALYQNGLLRLWSLLDARCIFKKKIGLPDQDSSEEILSKPVAQRPEIVKWEPQRGQLYGVLLTKKLELYSVESDEPLHNITFDTNQTGFDFVTSDAVVVCDDMGRLSLFQNLNDEICMKIIETSETKFRTITGVKEFFVTVSKSGIQVWDTRTTIDATNNRQDDMLVRVNPQRQMQLQSMILCACVTQIKHQHGNNRVKDKKKRNKKSKFTKDEIKILKRQKKV